jgi:hypothetical protein
MSNSSGASNFYIAWQLITRTMLTLNRASKSRPSGTWSDDDYDVLDGDQHVGRIMWTHGLIMLAE